MGNEAPNPAPLSAALPLPKLFNGIVAQPSSSSSSSQPIPQPSRSPQTLGTGGCLPLPPTRLALGGHHRGRPRPGVGFGTPKSPAGPRCLGLRCPKSPRCTGPLGAPCPRAGVPTSHRAHIPCQRRCLGTLCSRCPRGHKALSEPLMNSALMRGVQLKYQTPPLPPRGVRTALGRGQAGGPHCPPWLLCPPSLAQPGPAGWCHLAVSSPLDKGWGAQRGGG